MTTKKTYSPAITRVIGPIVPSMKANVPALYSAPSHFLIPALKSGTSGRHMSTAPAISKNASAPHDSTLSKFFDIDDSDFFKHTLPGHRSWSSFRSCWTLSGIGSIATISIAWVHSRVKDGISLRTSPQDIMLLMTQNLSRLPLIFQVSKWTT